MTNTVEWASCDDEPGYFGSDLKHALSAWTSTSRDLTEEKRARVPALLGFLATEGHTSPFEKSYLHFLVTADTASHIHIIKHRIGVSVNAESARYKEFKNVKIHVPEDWPTDLQDELRNHSLESFELYHTVLAKLEDAGYSRKRAKESARYFLPFSLQITMDIGFNFLSFAKFQKLRNDDHAQVEIHDIAQKMLDLVEQTGRFEHSLRAFKLIT